MQSNDGERIAGLERKVDYLIRYLGIDPAQIAGGFGPADSLPPGLEVAPRDEMSSASLGPVYDAIRTGKKINAIKLYRELTGASLAEAKSAVESMERGF
jgi:ribosomal protein L7/L12